MGGRAEEGSGLKKHPPRGNRDMKIPATDVRVGDYIQGLGTVENVRFFLSEESVTGSVRNEDSESYARQISQELEACYKPKVSKITFETEQGARTYYPEDSVEVMRISARSDKSEAA